MMKKTLFLLSALLLAGIGAKAQETVHKCEAVFNDWSISGNSGGSFQRNTWSTEEEAAGMVTPFIEYWVGTGSVLSNATISHTALTGLETGYYEVSIFARAFNEGSTTAVSKGITFTANDESVDLTEGTAGEYNGVSEESYGVYELLVYVEDGTLNIGFTIQDLTACDWLAFKNLEVTYLGETPVGYVAHECEAYGDDWGKPAHWTADNDSSTNLHVNKHSTEADPSGMVTPFVEYWYTSGTNLPDDVLRHDQLTGLYPGNYAVSLEVRAFNESGTTAITSGTTFNAISGDNSASVDITNAGLTSSTAYNSHYELYGTLNLIATVGETGTLDINITVSDANYNWLAFKNLKVEYDGNDMPTLEYVTGTMNTTVEEAMKAAVDAYNSSKSSENYTVALAAIAAAEESVAQYAEIAALVEALDDAGKAAWETTTSASSYNAKTLAISDDITADMTAAQKAQTTADTDWSYVLKNDGTWVNAIGATNFQQCPSLSTAHEVWSASAWSLPDGFTAADAIYKRIENLPAGQYTISFYAYGSEAENASRPLAFANNSDQTAVAYASALEWNEFSLYTMSCTVNASGELNFGMKTQGDGNWYVIEEGSLTLVALAEIEDTESEYKKGDAIEIDSKTYYVQCDNMVENHSFELGFTGWTEAIDFTTEIAAENFDLRSNAHDGNVCLVGTTNAGISGAGSLGKAWTIEIGKTYYFSYYVKNLTTNALLDTEYLKTSLTNNPGTETSAVGYPASVGSEWQKVEYKFTNDSYAYVQVDFRWLDSQWAFDNFQLYEIDDVLPIDWTLGADYGTLILPFDYDLSNTDLTAYTGAINSDGDEMVLTEVDDNAITAYTPYIIGGTAATYTFSGVPGDNTETSFTDETSGLTGVLEDTYAPANSYVLQKQEDTPAFYLVETADEILVAAYHCYLSESAVSGTGVKSITFTFGDDVATRIDAVETEETGNEAIYDLSGRRVAKAQKGIYIVNGKKMVIK